MPAAATMPPALFERASPPRGGERLSPLLVSDRLLTLAQDAERSGLVREAGRILRLALRVYDRG